MNSIPANSAEVTHRLATAVAIAMEAGEETLKLFRNKDLKVDRKQDSSPVTAADRASETLLRERIAAAFPDDGILGEEFGETAGTSPFRWILDPIDGTKSFIHGAPLYTTLVAVTYTPPHESDTESEQPLIGVIHSPATRETVYAATGGGCWYRTGDSPPTKTQVSETEQLSDSLLLTTDVAAMARERNPAALDAYLELMHACRLSRTWGDAYGYLMVATGRAEVMIDPKLSLWDAAALKPVIEEAGGVYTDWQGEPSIHSGDAVATNRRVSEQVLGFTRGK
ncbi:Histidinol-phosphatase [Posidoniimonas polymericola]|uniref:Histidinol-phosphatase n=1 Tax=Posidoniimonas polymericola TaxID=2528002 RepID=A0A5C5YMM0_9BACT|nr:histidinol-phosphatase [Posidoniimonas polymericola]TWT76018.1 Histidinol-phosphatase [Posidoniimonas polymericola]